MIIDGSPLASTVVLVDTNAIIEAVRTRTWNALTGGMRIQTVNECVEEAGRGNSNKPAYVAVSKTDLNRLDKVHSVSETDRAHHLLTDPDAIGMDPGERDLFAHACVREEAGDSAWVVCSPDKASIRAAVRLGWEDRLVSSIAGSEIFRVDRIHSGYKLRPTSFIQILSGFSRMEECSPSNTRAVFCGQMTTRKKSALLASFGPNAAAAFAFS